MTNEEKKKTKQAVVAGYAVVSAIAIVSGIGMIFGYGAAVLTFGLICLLIAVVNA